VMESVGEPPLQNCATSSAIPLANTPNRQQEKRKEPEIIENRLFADCMTDIYTNYESSQMDCSDDIYDQNEFHYPCTNALLSLSQPVPSGKDARFNSDSEEEYANFMPSLDISDESQVSNSSIDTHTLKLRFQWKPMPPSKKAEDLSLNAELKVKLPRPGPEPLRLICPKYFATQYPLTPLDPVYKEQFFWGKVHCCASSCGRVTKFCSA
jgi:hypothetical protein